MAFDNYNEADLEVLQIYRASTDPVIPHDFQKHAGGTILSRDKIIAERLQRIANREESGPISKTCWAETTAAAQPLTGNANCVNMPLFLGTFTEIAKQYFNTKGDPEEMLPDHAFEIPVPTSLDPNADSPQGFEAISTRSNPEEESALFEFTKNHEKAAEQLRRNIKLLRDIVFLRNYERHNARLERCGMNLDVPKRTWTKAAIAIQEGDEEDTCLDLLEGELLGPLVDNDAISTEDETEDGQAGLDMF